MLYVVACPSTPGISLRLIWVFESVALRIGAVAIFGLTSTLKYQGADPKRHTERREQRYLQFRFETYNTFNHTQFSGVDTAARFDAAGVQTNARFGQYTSVRNARQVQLGLKFAF